MWPRERPFPPKFLPQSQRPLLPLAHFLLRQNQRHQKLKGQMSPCTHTHTHTHTHTYTLTTFPRQFPVVSTTRADEHGASLHRQTFLLVSDFVENCNDTCTRRSTRVKSKWQLSYVWTYVCYVCVSAKMAKKILKLLRTRHSGRGGSRAHEKRMWSPRVQEHACGVPGVFSCKS